MSKTIIGAAVMVLLTTVRPTHASQVELLSQTQLMQGQESFTYALQVSEPGDITIDVSDLHWLGSINGLDVTLSDSYGLLDASDSLGVAGVGGPAEEMFHVTAPGTYYVHVDGQAQGSYDLDLFALHAREILSSTTPVPLPASGWLLLAACGGLLSLGARNKRLTSAR